MNNRIAQIRACLASPSHAFVIMRPENRRYITGFTGSAGVVVITQETAILITDFRYVEQAGVEAPDYQIIEHQGPLLKTLAQVLKKQEINRLAFEQDYVTFGQYEVWSKELGVQLVPVEGWVERLRRIKDQQEIAAIRRSISIADRAFEHVLGLIKPGIKELEVAQELEFFMRRAGASALAFDSIVASGPRSALPHAQPTERAVEAGEMLKMDFGCIVQGYCSDLTRTVGVGQLSEQHQRIYHIVLEAQLAGIKAIRSGVTGQAVDKVARDMIAEAGFGNNFGHSLGHSLGLVVHETPWLSTSETTVLEPGMVLTVEPGIYLPGWGGVRIEDVVVVTADGCEILTQANKQLLII